MMCLHELGHIIDAVLSRGRVTHVVLNPLAFSRTDVSPNPHPAFVAWGGVTWGSVLPALAWLPVRGARLGFLARFLAGFCLIVNGAYFASAAVMRVGDTEDLLRADQPLWAIVGIGLLLAATGTRLWNGLGPSFSRPPRGALRTTAAAFGLLLTAMALWTVGS
jgi:hypothetical protein